MFDKPWSGNYILNEQGEPEHCDDILAWSAWHHTDERRHIRKQQWTNDQGQDIFVSTVFLGMDHNFFGGPPVLWETMAWVNGESETDEHELQWRYTSREAAIAGHARVVLDLGGTPLDAPAPAHEH